MTEEQLIPAATHEVRNRQIAAAVAAGATQTAVAAQWGLRPSAVSRIVTRLIPDRDNRSAGQIASWRKRAQLKEKSQ